MLNEHISKYHDRINLNIDVERLGKEYLDFKYHLGFKTDNPANIDFNAICINRIPGDPRSISVVMFVVYIGQCLIPLMLKNNDYLL